MIKPKGRHFVAQLSAFDADGFSAMQSDMAVNRAQECKDMRAKAGTFQPLQDLANCYCDESTDYLVCASKAMQIMDDPATVAPGNATALHRGPLMAGDDDKGDSSKSPCGVDVRGHTRLLVVTMLHTAWHTVEGAQPRLLFWRLVSCPPIILLHTTWLFRNTPSPSDPLLNSSAPIFTYPPVSVKFGVSGSICNPGALMVGIDKLGILHDDGKFEFTTKDALDSLIGTTLGATMKFCLGVTGLSDVLAMILGWETCIGANLRLMPAQQIWSLGVFGQILFAQLWAGGTFPTTGTSFGTKDTISAICTDPTLKYTCSQFCQRTYLHCVCCT